MDYKDYKSSLLNSLLSPDHLSQITEDAFKVADRDRNGYIDIEEFEHCMKNVSESFGLSYPQREKVIKEFERLNTNKNGSIDFDEFKIYVKEIIDQILFRWEKRKIIWASLEDKAIYVYV